jgi:conjugal transfer ATP-binding protein TraC
MKALSLTKAILSTSWISDGLIENAEGVFFKAFEVDPLSSGIFEDCMDGPMAEAFYQKFSDLLTRLPNLFDGQVILFRLPTAEDIQGFKTTIIFFEKVKKPESYSHFNAVLGELKLFPKALTSAIWNSYVQSMLGPKASALTLPDIVWEKDCIRAGDQVLRVLSLTELPQVTWKGCLQAVLESPHAFTFSLKFSIPDRKKIKRQLETKRRVSHALSITSSLEVKNIESNSVLHSSEETLERILVNKETLFEISAAVLIAGTDKETLSSANNFERVVSGIGNAGLYPEGLGSLPVIISHLAGGKTLSIRKLPILSENLAQIFPLAYDYSRSNDASSLALRSRNDEVCNLNLFSKENLNFNSFICGASGSGKSFLMNAILSSLLKDEPTTRLCIFDIGGSYRRIIEAHGGVSQLLSVSEAHALIASFLAHRKVDGGGFFRTFIETLCGSGSHITHSHRVAIDDLLRQIEGTTLRIGDLILIGMAKHERFYQDVAHWLKPHVGLDAISQREDLQQLIRAQVTAFDFKELDADPVLQRTAILLLSELLWGDLVNGTYTRTLIVFDEVWRFFAQSKSFLEEMYRTLRKYRAGIVSITQNLADYGDEAFAKMIFTNSFTKIFLQNGAAAEFLKQTFDLPECDVIRALSVTSKKPLYSEFFALSPTMSQVFRLYPTAEFYKLANTENVATRKELN